MLSPDQIAAYTTSVLFGAAAAFERYKSSRVTKKTEAEAAVVSDAKRQEERGNLMAKMADDYKALLEKEYTAHQATRDYWHEKANDFQKQLAKCNEDCAALQMKTDLSTVQVSLLTIAKGVEELLRRPTIPPSFPPVQSPSPSDSTRA
jgi:hypothetical protein